MIVFLWNELDDDECCAIKTRHFEIMEGRIEIVYPSDGDITCITIEDGEFRWGERYEFISVSDNDDEYLIREASPDCKWFED